MWEWSNLHEFLAMASLVTIATTFVLGFRYAIYKVGNIGVVDKVNKDKELQ